MSQAPYFLRTWAKTIGSRSRWKADSQNEILECGHLTGQPGVRTPLLVISEKEIIIKTVELAGFCSWPEKP